MFSKRLKSFLYALQGIVYLLKTQPNARIHLFFTISVIALGIFFQVRSSEWMLMIWCIGGVWATEAVNTALEELVNWISPDYHDKAKHVKDVAAAAVFIVAIASAMVGLIIFVPYIVRFLWD
jgi:diacylglycerol kinase